MQTPLFRKAALAVFGLCWLAAPASAQTTVEPRALDSLGGTPPATPAAPDKTPPKPAPRRDTATPVTRRVVPPPAKPAAPPPPVVPAAPPPVPVIPPPITVPVRPTVPPPPAEITADAPGISTPIPDGVRVTFGIGHSDLNPATASAIRALAHAAPTNSTFTVSAYAAGAPEDPSTPRRLSLSRVLAVRSLLITEGIASIRIYPKALGAYAPALVDGTLERADIVVGPPPPAFAPTGAATVPAVATAPKTASKATP